MLNVWWSRLNEFKKTSMSGSYIVFCWIDLFAFLKIIFFFKYFVLVIFVTHFSNLIKANDMRSNFIWRHIFIISVIWGSFCIVYMVWVFVVLIILLVTTHFRNLIKSWITKNMVLYIGDFSHLEIYKIIVNMLIWANNYIPKI